MLKNILLWLLAFIITAGTAIYQRSTGPTYPVKGETKFNNAPVLYKFDRSHGGETNHEVAVISDSAGISAFLYYKRFKTNDNFTQLPMKYREGSFNAELPHQPPAGKLEYFVIIKSDSHELQIPSEHIVIRFKGDVPIWILIPHVIFMFLAMMLAARTGLQYFTKDQKVISFTKWTMAILAIGGFILGPLMQEYAFGELWTGVPFGYDLTDNKTLIAMIVWLIAFFRMRKSGEGKTAAKWALAAFIIMFFVYLIPHSVLGSELDYNKLDNNINTEITTQQ